MNLSLKSKISSQGQTLLYTSEMRKRKLPSKKSSIYIFYFYSAALEMFVELWYQHLEHLDIFQCHGQYLKLSAY